ncbi:signal recognition particle-docking protein FtsY [Corynebacterium renale]|uniref:Signal recognition particle receptor FtsY n=1 Tax=Corynebacterium renale TaxID=1724 RepID=A0A2A9DQ43_9CORY|nr:signal recognition particle-docking protein FtsY [Corynebacterium renale]PFG28476.1 signal recognition particle-docking protein FtsY [Corynebacterium renale]SQI26344.1 signal recognition particle-docking protein FtsY [Corynebacterium renale]
MDNNLLLIGGIILAVAVVIIAALVIVGRKRKDSKTISFEQKEEPKELTQQEKSGNYQATGGFNFAPASREPVPAAGQDIPEPKSPQAQAPEPVREVPEVAPTPQPEPTIPTAKPTAEEDQPLTEAEAPGENTPVDVVPETTEPVPSKEQDVPTEVVEPVATEEAEAAEELVVVDENAPEEPVIVETEDEAVEVVEESAPSEAEAALLTSEEEAAQAAEVAAEIVDGAEAALDKVEAPAVPDVSEVPQPAENIEEIAPAAGRLGRLRGRLSRSQNMIGSSLLGILSAGDLDEDAWEEIEDTLIMADLGTPVTMKVVDALRTKIAERGVSSEEEARAMLRETLIEAGRPELDRSVKAMPYEGKPAVVLVVGVNGTGKTTTTGKLARVLVSMGHHVVLGAADTFRAAAADQLETWGRRVGATTVRGAEGADPASVAFDSVAQGIEQHADVVLIDTAGRLHTSRGLMDQLGKVKRVVEKRAKVDEVLLVLDATVGQNGLMQARTFAEVVDITGVVLTKLDGTAKGGIVFQVQEELGVPVKLVGLGEGADDLAPFEVEGFVDALLG